MDSGKEIDYTELSLDPSLPPLTTTHATPHETTLAIKSRVRLVFEPSYNEFEFYCLYPRLDASFTYEEYVASARRPPAHIMSETQFAEMLQRSYADGLRPRYVYAHRFGYDTALPPVERYTRTRSSVRQPPSSWRNGQQIPSPRGHTPYYADPAGGHLLPIEPITYVSFSYFNFHACARDLLSRILQYSDFLMEFAPERYSALREWAEVEDDGVPPM